jgi:hypothetical protein
LDQKNLGKEGPKVEDDGWRGELRRIWGKEIEVEWREEGGMRPEHSTTRGRAVMRCERARGKTRTSTSTEEKKERCDQGEGAVAAGHGRCSHRVGSGWLEACVGVLEWAMGWAALGFAFFFYHFCFTKTNLYT